MRDQVGDREHLAALHLVGERAYRLLAQRVVRGTQIQQVRIMSYNDFDAGFLLVLRKALDFIFGVVSCRPLARRLGEDLDRVAGDSFSEKQRLIDATGNRHVRTEEGGAGCLSTRRLHISLIVVTVREQAEVKSKN